MSASEQTLQQEGSLEYYHLEKLLEDSENTMALIAELSGVPMGCGFGQRRKNEPFNKEKFYGYIALCMSIAHRGEIMLGEPSSKNSLNGFS